MWLCWRTVAAQNRIDCTTIECRARGRGVSHYCCFSCYMDQDCNVNHPTMCENVFVCACFWVCACVWGYVRPKVTSTLSFWVCANSLCLCVSFSLFLSVSHTFRKWIRWCSTFSVYNVVKSIWHLSRLAFLLAFFVWPVWVDRAIGWLSIFHIS